MTRRTKAILAALQSQANPERARFAGAYVGIKPGGYGEGDVMLGVTQPQVRVIERGHAMLTQAECEALLDSRFHEARMVGVLGMMRLAKKADAVERRALARAYVAHAGVNNWDLIDVTAPHVVGAKESSCGCAGLFNAPFALEAYAQVFDEEGALDRFEAFTSLHGPAFYGLPVNQGSVTLERAESPVPGSIGEGSAAVVPYGAGGSFGWRLASA